MAHRHIRYSGPMVDTEMDQQGPVHLTPYGNMSNFQQPNVVATGPGGRNNFVAPHPPEHQGSFGMTQYNVAQHQFPAGNIDLAATAASNHYNMFMAPPSSARAFPAPLNNGPYNQFLPSSNHGIEFSADSYSRNAHFMDGFGVSSKRKNAEVLPTHFQYASAGASSSAAPVRPESDVGPVDASFVVPDNRGNDMSAVVDIGSHRSMRNRTGAVVVESIVPHNPNQLIRGQFPGQAFHTAPPPWIDQQFNSNAGDVGVLTWNQPHALPYLHGNFNGGGMDAVNMGVQAYQVTANNRTSAAFLPPPLILPGHFNVHHPSPPLPPMQGVRGRSIELPSQVAMSLHRPLANGTSPATMNAFQDSAELSSRLVGSFQPAGLRYIRPHRRELMLDPTARQQNLHHLRILPEDGVALLELSDYHAMGESVDDHRDMRLDIDHMSYEELLALGEQIGSVGSGLSEEFINGHLRTRKFTPSAYGTIVKDAASVDQEFNFCVVCQTEYEDEEKMGILDCGHEYHLECLKAWLLVKNSCPICKSAALTTEENKEE